MALTEKEKKRLDKLDFAVGGGFSDFMAGRKKATPSGSKFLFVGLGGKGSKTVAALKTGAYKKILCPKDQAKPENFEYLIVDTDAEAIGQLVKGGYGEVGLSNAPQDLETCQLYDAEAAKKLIPGNRKLIPSNIQEWISPSINAQLQGNGAGGIRQAGRYLLFGEGAFKILERALTLKLQKLHQQIVDSAREKLIVYLFAGVGGGTGSGTVIDIPYIIREICKKNKWKVQICGYIFLPDTYPEEARGNHLRYNSYAALKEIDTLMKLGQMDGAAHFRATYVPGFSVDSTEAIFDSCVLVSGKKNSGLVSQPDRFTRNVVVDHVLNLVTDNQADGVFLANSFLDNHQTEIINAVSVLPKEVPVNAYYQYNVIGTGEIILPMEQILAYLAQGTMEKMERAWDRHPEQRNVEEALTQLHMLPEEQAADIESRSHVSVLQYSKGMADPAGKAEVLSGALQNTIKQLWMQRNTELYNAWDTAKNQCLERIIKDLDKQYYKMFTDPECGLYYLQEFFASRVIDGKALNGICFRVSQEYLAQVDALVSGQLELQRQIDARMEDIKVELGGVLGGTIKKNALVEEYKELCVGKLAADNRIYLYNELVRDCLKQIVKHLENKLQDLQKYIDVFAYLKEIIAKNYKSVMDGSLLQAEYAGRLIDFSKKDDNTEQVISYLDGLLAQETPEGLVTGLEDRIVHTERQWVNSEEDFEPMKVFVRFLEERYSQIPNLTIEKFLQIKYGKGGLSTGVRDLCNELKSKAEVIFPTGPALSLNSLASIQYVVLPAGALDIKEALAEFAKQNGANVAESSDPNSIFWYNLVVGMPLFANNDIAEYEKLYEANVNAGMHLWESESDNWKDFPALTNQTLWGSPNENPRERKFADEVKANTALYLQKGLIRKEVYKADCVIPDSTCATREAALRWCREEYLAEGKKDASGLFAVGAVMWEQFCKRFAEEMCEYNVNIPTVYMKVTDENLHEMLRLNIFLYKQLRKTYELYTVCEEAVNEANRETLEKQEKLKNIGRFYDYVRMGILQFQEDMILLEKKNGDQEEVLYYENYTVLENRFSIYWAVRQMTEKYSEEELKDLDEYCQELSEDHSPEARARHKEVSDHFMEECSKVRESLKKIDTKKMLKDAGKENMIEEYTEFYDALIRMRRG